MSKARHQLTTPEGIELTFAAANLGDRLSAVLIDLGVIVAISFAAFLPAALLRGGDLAIALGLFVSFVARTFYFIWFEWRRGGSTPGKKRMGLRVIDARGGVLQPGAVVARNLTREVEMFLPLVALFSPELLVSGGTGLTRLIAVAWMLVFLLLPIVTRRRLRIGDLIAGTRVVAMPATALLPDLGARREAIYLFGPEHLGHYGNRELQMLEDVLRRDSVERSTLRLIADKIRARIGWPDEPAVEPRRFLEDFYQAQRAGLERGLLFGRRHEDKAAARAARQTGSRTEA